ncbi:metallophosphoesterase [Botryobacter ruber]|uniref:metallophosphoesterase n=1 Tax=Botryobacter ruber TaxID=2171629 RepID=UPI000E0C82BB|nr:metallophosphoesterase [Botryobacter ruber]
MQRFILILVIITLILDWYVYQGIKRLTAGLESRQLRLAIRWGYWVLFTGLIVGFGASIYVRFSTDRATPVVQWFINAFLTFLITKLVFVLVLLAEDISRMFVAAFRFFRHAGKDDPKPKPLLPGRRKVVSQLALALAAVPFSAFVYGVTKGKYAFKVRRQVLYFEDLPKAFDGFTITQVSDVHAGSLDDAAAVQRGVELAQAQQSDLYVFTGDLVNNFASEIEPFMESFSQLKAPYGQFAILGNHDYGMYHEWPSDAAREENLEKLKRHHAEMGYRLLLDEHVVLKKGGEELVLLGVENWGRGFIVKGNLDNALKGVDKKAFKVLLSHDPSHWTEVVKQHPTHVHLTLSGHTHGMQFGVETPLGKWSPVQYRYENWAGLAYHNNRQLYVNRGFGFIGFAGRVGIWPEITVLELRKGKA